MMKESFSLIFYIRNSRADKSGRSLIYLRITVDFKRTEISVQRKVKPLDWDSISGKVRDTAEHALEINKHLDEILSNL